MSRSTKFKSQAQKIVRKEPGEQLELFFKMVARFCDENNTYGEENSSRSSRVSSERF